MSDQAGPTNAAPTPHVLVVTSAGAHAAVVVPVLAALEAAGMRVRAIDVGNAGGGGAGMADRVRRALLGESAERRLRKELESNPPDVTLAFDPDATLALTVARDQVAAPAPVVAVIGDLEPGKDWAQTAADRFLAVDAECAVALADLGVESERILVVGAFGPRAWAEAGQQDRAALRARFKLGGGVAVVEVAGMGAELTSQIALQLSLAQIAESTTFLFDAGTDVEAAAVLRAKVPVLGLRAKLFGATADAPLLWRCAEVVVARPRPDSIAKAALIGARLVVLVDDAVAGAARIAAALEGRKRAVVARSPLLVSSALETLIKVRGPSPDADGADNVADIVWVVAGDKRAVIEERRAAERAETHHKVKAATSAAQAAARVGAVPGELEDLGGDDLPDAGAGVPDQESLARLVAETQQRKREMERAMMGARDGAESGARKAEGLRKAGNEAEARDAQQRADRERSRMHSLLGELGQLESELRELERAVAAARSVPAGARAGRGPDPVEDLGAEPAPRARPAPPASSVDDVLAQMKRQSGSGGGAAAPPPKAAPRAAAGATVDDELAALKRKMAQTSSQKKK